MTNISLELNPRSEVRAQHIELFGEETSYVTLLFYIDVLPLLRSITVESLLRLEETPKGRNERIEKEAYHEWLTRMRRTTSYWDQFFRGYDLDELETTILEAMENKWETGGDDYTVSVIEIAKVFGRDPHNIRDTMKRMEKKGIIKMVEYRKTPSGQMEKRYALKQFYEDLMADIEKDKTQ